MARFFIAGTNLLGSPTAIIRGRDAEHIQVLRIRPGEDVTICDTQGTDYKCRLVRATKEEAELEVVEVVPCRGEPSVAVTVLCGLPKGDRVDYIIQKSVEAGAGSIVFFNPRAALRSRTIRIRNSNAGTGSAKRPQSSPAAGSFRRSAGRKTMAKC